MQDSLNRHTFPLEAHYQNIDSARQVYPSLIITLLANGTTMYFATVQEEATQWLASTCQLAYLGRVAMDDTGEIRHIPMLHTQLHQ